MEDKIIAYKGFDEKMQCYGGFQYAEGEEYIFPGKVKVCGNGGHSCENPLDVFKYFQPNGRNTFRVVECSGAIDRTEYDSNGALLCCKMHKVDGKTVKPDTLYTLKDGKFVAAED